MTELKPLLFSSAYAGDSAVLADYLRSYGYLLRDADAPDTADAREEAPPRLLLSRTPGGDGVTLTWTQDGRTWSRREEVRPSLFAESEENRLRRVIRLAFHHLLENEAELREIIQSPPAPWGTLTGVRPSKMLHRFLDQGLGDGEILDVLAGDFGVEAGRGELLLRIAHNQRPFLPALEEGRKKISLYLSYPFCPSRCGYCSFPGYEAKRWKKWQEPYHRAMELEIRRMGEVAASMGFLVETLYFGGGTPTCMPPSAMDGLLRALEESFALLPGLEWTVEGGRPETLTEEMLDVLEAHPVSRLCVNPQSMNQRTLDRIGRRHEAGAVEEAFRRIRTAARGSARTGGVRKRAANETAEQARGPAQEPARESVQEMAREPVQELGWEPVQKPGRGPVQEPGPEKEPWRINCDLILGLPGEGLAEVEESLKQVLALRPENVTVHGLAIKRGSAYKEQRESLPGRRIGLAMTELSRGMLRAAGYTPYYLYRQKDSLAGGENVGYCLPGSACLYNMLMIEERQTVLGLGAGAGSKFLLPGSWSLENSYNPKDMIQYIERTEELIRRKVDKLAGLG